MHRLWRHKLVNRLQCKVDGLSGKLREDTVSGWCPKYALVLLDVCGDGTGFMEVKDMIVFPLLTARGAMVWGTWEELRRYRDSVEAGEHQRWQEEAASDEERRKRRRLRAARAI